MKKYISRITGDAISAQVETTLISIGDKTEMQICWTGKGKIFFLKLLMPLLRGRLIRQSQSDLEKFKEMVETRGFDFSEGQEKSI